jgi:hypothetical protein
MWMRSSQQGSRVFSDADATHFLLITWVFLLALVLIGFSHGNLCSSKFVGDLALGRAGCCLWFGELF